MTDLDASPFFSLKNVPLWVSLILCVTLAVVAVGHHRTGAQIVAAGTR